LQRVHLYLIIVTLIYAATYTLAKWIMPVYIGAYGFIVLRIATAAVLLTLVTPVFSKEKIPLKEHWKDLAICAFFGVAANMLMFFKGLSITNEINAAVLMLFAPVFVFIFSLFIKSEKFYWWNVVGIFIAGIGALMFIGGVSFHFNKLTAFGDLLIALNATSYAFYLVYVRKLLKKYHPIVVTKYTFYFGLLFVIPFGYKEVFTANYAGMEMIHWFALIFILVLTTFVTYVLNAMAIKRGGATLVGAYIYLQPVLAALIAHFAGADKITITKVAFAALIFFGVYLVSIKKYATN
jgi:drug/metabolite transporter (DMT)-like permease